MRHVMLDLETLGTKPPAVILSIGAVEFSSAGLRDSFYQRIDIGSSILDGFIISPETLKWWHAQGPAAKAAAFWDGPAVPLFDALGLFASFVDKETFLWAKGPDFDCVLLNAAYEFYGLPVPWSFRHMRDVRTILAVSEVHQSKGMIAHHALDDAKAQAWAVIEAYRALDKEL